MRVRNCEKKCQALSLAMMRNYGQTGGFQKQEVITGLLNDEWHVSHLSTQDDYLMRLFFMAHGQWPDGKNVRALSERVRKRPTVLDECQLPEYRKSNNR